MIGTLARKRTNWVALAVLAALAVALFAVLQTTRADEHPNIKITINDSDNVVKAGNYNITLAVERDGNAAANDTITYVRIAESTTDVLVTGTVTTENEFTPAGGAGGTLVVREGAAGTFTIIAGVAEDASGAGLISGELEIVVGDIGMGVGSAELSLGYTNAAGDELAAATDTGAKQDSNTADASASAGTGADNIVMVLTVKNTLGNLTNDGDVNNITILAQGGRLNDPASPITALSGAIPAAGQAGSASYTDAAGATATRVFTVSRGSSGTVEVFAFIVGTDGSQASTERFTLKFAGDPEAVSLGDASGSLDDGDTDDRAADPANADGAGVYIDVTGLDGSGTPSGFTAGTDITATVTKAPEGGGTTHLTLANELGTSAATTAALGAIRVYAHVTTGQSPVAGDYTITVTLGTDAATAKTTTVTVVGDPATVELSADMTEATFGDIVTLTAMVKDKNGNPVANSSASEDDDGVVFTWAASGLTATTLDGDNAVTDEREIVKGAATARFVVTSRTGDAIVIANAAGKRDTISLSSSEAAADDAAEADGPSLGDFSRTSGVASYTGPDATASDLLALLAGRATIIWLSDGENWTAYYALIDGSEAPGSSNFTVTSGDVLYIGN